MDRRRYFLVATAAAVVLGLASLSGNAAAQDPGRDYYMASSYSDGMQMLRNLNQNHYRPASEKLSRGHYSGVEGDLDFMLKYFPNHPQALAGMAQLAIGLKRPYMAERYFKNAIERYPDHDETYMIYGVFLHRLGRLQPAIAQYEKALEINPDSALGHYNLGLAYVDIKRYREANVHAQKAYQLGVTLPGLRRQLEAAKAWDPSVAPGGDSAGKETADGSQREAKPE
ncbi:MAG: tetratricopeptide repeat protein [Burkholderiales bacterium]|nr:tetratricopeptide repeat protein [Burkholderiales bacterium]